MGSRKEAVVGKTETDYRYSWRKDGKFIDGSDCIHTAKSQAEELMAELWRHLPERSYMVTDYAVPPGERPGE